MKNKRQRTKLLSALLSLALILSLIPTAVFAQSGNFGGGDGTAENPYIVEDLADLNAIRNNLNACYKLGADINVNGTFTTISGSFYGELDGNGHTIYGITGYSSNFLFGSNIGKIKNLTISVNISMTATSDIGYNTASIFCGGNDGTISNCIAKGSFVLTCDSTMTGEVYVGAFVAGNTGTISNCINYADITVTNNYGVMEIGGIAGYNRNYVADKTAYIIGCVNEGVISGKNRVGGITGYNANGGNGVVKSCANNGKVTATASNCGGIAGDSGNNNFTAVIQNCYNTGAVTGAINVGGIVGSQTYSASVSGVYNSGNVTGTGVDAGGNESRIGGIVGVTSNSSINYAYNMGAVTGMRCVGGIVGYAVSNASENIFNIGKITATGSNSDSYVGGLYGFCTQSTFTTGQAKKDVFFNSTQAVQNFGTVNGNMTGYIGGINIDDTSTLFSADSQSDFTYANAKTASALMQAYDSSSWNNTKDNYPTLKALDIKTTLNAKSVSSGVISFPYAEITGGYLISSLTASVTGGTVAVATSSNVNVNYSVDNSTAAITFDDPVSIMEASELLRNNVKFTLTGDTSAKITVTADSNNTLLSNTEGMLFAVGSGNYLGHYYMYVPEALTYANAYNAAKNYYYKGLKGYLVTITSAEENSLLDNLTTASGWSAGSRFTSLIYDTSTWASTTTDSYYRWICGPEAGTIFYNGASYSDTGAGVAGTAYNNWTGMASGNQSEPNNSGGLESCMQVHYGSARLWNDLNPTNRIGYFVEFGGYSNDPGTVTAGKSSTDTLTITLPNATLVFAPNNGTYNGSSGNTSVILKNTNKTATLGTPTRTGYNFTGWKIDGVGTFAANTTATYSLADSGVNITIGNSVLSITSDAFYALVAQWSPKNYTVTHTLTDMTSPAADKGANKATQDAAYSTTLTADTYFNLPSSVTVSVAGNTLTSGTDYTYNSSTGKISITASKVTGDIVIVASGSPKQYSVTNSLTNMSSNGSTGNNAATYKTNYTATLSADTYYHLPDSIIVKAGENTVLTSGTDYVYTKSTGALTVYGTVIKDNLTITASALPDTYTVTHALTYITSPTSDKGADKATYNTKYETTLTADTYYHLPDTVSVTVGNTTLTTSEYTYSSSTGKIEINADKIKGTVLITATGIPNSFNVFHNLFNITAPAADSGTDKATYKTDYTTTITADSNYSLPYRITVTIGGISTYNYSYNNNTGIIIIPGNTIIGDIQITAKSNPKVLASPSSTAAQEGKNAVFSVSVKGALLSYQWQTYKDNKWVNIAGAKDSTLTLKNVKFSDNLTIYRCVVTDGNNQSVASEPAVLSVFMSNAQVKAPVSSSGTTAKPTAGTTAKPDETKEPESTTKVPETTEKEKTTAKASGTTTTTKASENEAEKNPNFNWLWILLIIFVLLIFYFLYKRNKDKNEQG